MRAVMIHGERDIQVQEVPDPTLLPPQQYGGLDAVVQVIATCVCGSDLWYYRGISPVDIPQRIGHEFVGVVEAVGPNVNTIKPGDFVIAPFMISDGLCLNCQNGFTSACINGGFWGVGTAKEGFADGAQSERVRVPLADSTLVPVPGGAPDPQLIPSLLTLSDVMATGHHAAVSAGVQPGSTVAVVGDGAVGLCAIIAAKRLGASVVVAMSRHQSRQQLAREFGAEHIVAERGDEAVAAVKELFSGIGPDYVLECVGTAEAMDQALRSARPGGQVGFVGVPAGMQQLPVGQLFSTNVGVRGGIAPVRTYVPQLLPDVLEAKINPGRVFDLQLSLEQAVSAYQAMDERNAIKVLLRP